MSAKKVSATRVRRPVGRRGRPQKYGRPGEVLTVTLPVEVIRALRLVDADIGWAIVSLVDRAKGAAPRAPDDDVRLAGVGAGQSLIVVNPDLLRSLPGVQMVPLSDSQAFLALAPDRGMADLEVAVVDWLEQLSPANPEHAAVARLRDQLRTWRKDPRLAFEARSIILVSKKKKAT